MYVPKKLTLEKNFIVEVFLETEQSVMPFGSVIFSTAVR